MVFITIITLLNTKQPDMKTRLYLGMMFIMELLFQIVVNIEKEELLYQEFNLHWESNLQLHMQ
jgi:hypothetical protein